MSHPPKQLMADSPVKVNNPGGAPESASPEDQKKMETAYNQMKRKMSISVMGKAIKHKIMVLSGKGGVGKSTVATGLALSLAQQGLKVGLLDIDITGPNVPKMMGLDGRRLNVDAGRIHPAEGHLGVKVISMAFLLEDEDTPVVWRGPIKLGAIQQFIGDVEWGDLDYLIIDFPPGTSDEPLTVAQNLPDIDGMVIVTTPQDVALLDSRKSITFSKSLKVDVIGVIENMSGYTIHGKAPAGTEIELAAPGGKTIKTTTDENGDWSGTLDIFKAGGGEKTASEFGVPFLGKLPFDPGFVRGGDDGVHRIVSEPEGPSAIAFAEVVAHIQSIVESAPTTSKLEII
jgi:Mrp family chromosome partitioning ATPase